jgi:predicted phosphodiesterase
VSKVQKFQVSKQTLAERFAQNPLDTKLQGDVAPTDLKYEDFLTIDPSSDWDDYPITKIRRDDDGYRDPVREAGRAIKDWMIKRNITEISLRDLGQRLAHQYGSTDNIRAIMDIMVEDGIMIRIEPPPTGKPGRPPGPSYTFPQSQQITTPQLQSVCGTTEVDEDALTERIREILQEEVTGIQSVERPVWQRNLDEIPDYTKAIVISDLHIPHHAQTELNMVLAFMHQQQFPYIFLNGDMLDCEAISRFPRNRYNVSKLKNECQITRHFLTHLREQNPDANIVYLFGNHEARVEVYARTHAQQLTGLVDISLPALLGLQEKGIEVQDSGFRENHALFGDIYIGHWDTSGKKAAYTAARLLDDMGVSVVQAHTHKCGMTQKHLLNGQILIGIESGCLCKLEPSWAPHMNWQHGFVVIHKIEGHCYPEMVPIRNQSFIYGGELWTADSLLGKHYE